MSGPSTSGVNSVPASFDFSTSFQNNSLFVLDCLPEGESSRQWLFNQLRDLQDFQGLYKHLKEIRVASSARLEEVLVGISEQVKGDWKPILHFECHGSRDSGLEIGDGRDIMAWSTLNSLLTRINSACGGHLGVVMGVCHGNSVLAPISVEIPTPFYFLAGSDGSPTNDEMEREMPAFYCKLFATLDLSSALQCLPSFEIFHAERFLVTQLAIDLKECLGSGRSDWREDLLSKIATRDVLETEQLRAQRTLIKAMTGEDALRTTCEAISKKFLQRDPSFDFDALLKYIRSVQIHL